MANFRLGTKQIEQVCALDADNRQLLELAMQRLSLSARAAHRILKVARTVADLGGVERIGASHLSEAIQYRCLDRAVSASNTRDKKSGLAAAFLC